LDAFAFRNRLIEEYGTYVKSFINIQDERIAAYVDDCLGRGVLWPEPLIQLNPSFELGRTIDELVEAKVLHQACGTIFRKGKGSTSAGFLGTSLRLHKHQEEAILHARDGSNYVLTTGTGSGKSLSYIIPIVDSILKSGPGRGIKAIVIYPMNALANSQFKELEKFLCEGFPDRKGPVTFAKYTGQESEEEREAILQAPPDILLTNYVMLELILTRVFERPLVENARGIRFLVLDELHTYRGRQGADVSMLVRRLREVTGSASLQCVGTSATMATGGSLEDQRQEVARVATVLFGAEVAPGNVVGETLRRISRKFDPADPALVDRLRNRVADSSLRSSSRFAEFVGDPLSVWIESALGLKEEASSGRLIRRDPRALSSENGASKELSVLTGLSVDRCDEAIRENLLAGFKCERHPETGFPPFAFRLHQFIGKGETVHATLESPSGRHITVQPQKTAPGPGGRVLIPLGFCRECGQEYWSVECYQNPDGKTVYLPRDPHNSAVEEDRNAGFLYLSEDNPWPLDDEAVIARLPGDWLEEGPGGTSRVRRARRENIPRLVRIDGDGIESGEGVAFHYIEAPLRFCLHCGVSYSFSSRKDFGRLATLSSEGRSTATTILSGTAIRELKNEETLLPEARKLLSFTDNRQDAALQAGHFNDFVEIGGLRAALAAAVQSAGPDGLSHEKIVPAVFAALNLPFGAYASDPSIDERFGPGKQVKLALQKVLGYRLYRDLKRGWRLTSPNLEQCGLLEIRYDSLEEVCAADDLWNGLHEVLVSARAEERFEACRVMLDHVRRELAIDIPSLDKETQEEIRRESGQRLAAPWALDEKEMLEFAGYLFPRSKQQNDKQGNVFLSAQSGYARFLKRVFGRPDLNREALGEIIRQILRVLAGPAGLVAEVLPPTEPGDVPGYRLKASALLWCPGDGTTPLSDPVRVPNQSSAGQRTNPYFVRFYRETARGLVGLEAREHTAQVSYEERIQRENDFRTAALPILYCSPTMELGIDIAELNVVNMRNVPPTPANYAQRSGRAGRSGQPAVVFTYCTAGSPHDQYFFRRPEKMVAGAVSPPRIDLANEDLIRAHVHAIWLAEARLDLGKSLQHLLDLNNVETLPFKDSVQAALSDENARRRTFERARHLLASVEGELQASDWYTSDWLEGVVHQIHREFESACSRWKDLYRAAYKQVETQNAILLDPNRGSSREEARRLRREAESQLDLLREAHRAEQSDFYSYRYFASEGFLPGYNFPRLPLSAFIPGRKVGGKIRDEYLSRPRFLAITEFGPRAFVYHEGSKYIIHRVILPVGENNLATRRAKRCETCGYLHPLDGGALKDRCDLCGAELGGAMENLFHLQNVVTQRRERINSDEEERRRLGFEVMTAVRFTEHGSRPSHRIATIEGSDGPIASLTYGPAALLWRINLGWLRRSNPDRLGFLLDVERGYWARSDKEEDPGDPDPMSPRTERVIPFVQDHRNVLIFTPSSPIGDSAMASLESAIKNAIQIRYQLEDSELSTEALPGRDDRRSLLFYESSEGGAGVLRRLIDDPAAVAEVAREALRLCHVDPETAETRPNACESACYDCLMSYSNQRDHYLLDRNSIREFLGALIEGTVAASPVPSPREQHLAYLVSRCESSLERKWIAWLNQRNLRLPTHAQKRIQECQTRPDFLYVEGGNAVAIYVDGPPHDFPDRQERDVTITDRMEDAGYLVIRFHHEADWEEVVRRFPSIFGGLA